MSWFQSKSILQWLIHYLFPLCFQSLALTHICVLLTNSHRLTVLDCIFSYDNTHWLVSPIFTLQFFTIKITMLTINAIVNLMSEEYWLTSEWSDTQVANDPYCIYWMNIWVNRHHSCKCVGHVILAPQIQPTCCIRCSPINEVSLAGLLLSWRFKKAAMLEGESFDFYNVLTLYHISLQHQNTPL